MKPTRRDYYARASLPREVAAPAAQAAPSIRMMLRPRPAHTDPRLTATEISGKKSLRSLRSGDRFEAPCTENLLVDALNHDVGLWVPEQGRTSLPVFKRLDWAMIVPRGEAISDILRTVTGLPAACVIAPFLVRFDFSFDSVAIMCKLEACSDIRASALLHVDWQME